MGNSLKGSHCEDNPEYVMFWLSLAKMYDMKVIFSADGLAQIQLLLAVNVWPKRE